MVHACLAAWRGPHDGCFNVSPHPTINPPARSLIRKVAFPYQFVPRSMKNVYRVSPGTAPPLSAHS